MNSLSVLHISTADNIGGSGRSAYKLHKGLRGMGVQSKMLVHTRITSDPDVDFIHKRWLKLIDLVVSEITDGLGLQYLYLPSSSSLLQHPWFKQAQIIQLYNTHGNYFSHAVLPAMSQKKKIVWRLSDMWPMTGHCAYSATCDKWKTGCRNCADLKTYPSIRWNSAALLWKQKMNIYRRSKIHIVAPSSWIKLMADESPLFKGYEKSLISNGVDTNIFKPLSKVWCRGILNIHDDKKIILFMVNSFEDNPRKGIEFFMESMKSLWKAGRRDFRVLLVGDGVFRWGHDLQCPVLRRDFVKEDELLSIIYNAADFNVHPAILENMPNSIVEAMSCGIPSVAFDTGGVRDAIDHTETGYLARFKDSGDLLQGIQWLMDLSDKTPLVSAKCRKTVIEKFSLERQANDFLNLYQCLLDRNVSS